jgi:hypothetical protein
MIKGWPLTNFVCVAALSFLPFHAVAEELWNGTYLGMSASEVVRSIPGTSPPLSPETSKNGAQELLEATAIPVGGHKATIQFWFRSGALESVQIVLGGPGKTDLGDAGVKELIGNLTHKYGTPIKCELVGNTARTCNWVKGKTFIGIVAVSTPVLPDAMAVLVYRGAPEAGNL